MLAHLSSSIALGHVVLLGVRLGTQGGPPIAVAHIRAVLLLLALLVVGLGNERALVVATRSNTWGTLDSCFQLATQGVPLAVHL